MTNRLIHWGTRAFKFAYVDSHGQFMNVTILKPFAGLKPGDHVSGIFMNPFTFKCYWWYGEHKVDFTVNELVAVANMYNTIDTEVCLKSAQQFEMKEKEQDKAYHAFPELDALLALPHEDKFWSREPPP